METDVETPLLQWRQWDGVLLREIPMAKFKDGVDPKAVTFNTGYADDGIASFAIFDRLQSEGTIPNNIKFQICLPTPLAPGYNFVSPRAQDDFIPAYTDHIISEVAKMVAEFDGFRHPISYFTKHFENFLFVIGSFIIVVILPH